MTVRVDKTMELSKCRGKENDDDEMNEDYEFSNASRNVGKKQSDQGPSFDVRNELTEIRAAIKGLKDLIDPLQGIVDLGRKKTTGGVRDSHHGNVN